MAKSKKISIARRNFLKGAAGGAAALAVFILALYSKESAFILVPLFALPLVFDAKLRARFFWLTPFAVLSGLAVAHVLYTRTYSFRFNDGSFS